MSLPVTGILAAERERKKAPRGKVQMYVTPGWEPEPEPPAVEKRQKRMLTDGQKKAVRLQRA